MTKRVRLFLLGVVLSWHALAHGTTFLTFQSTYLGDGWFRYRLNLANDPFFTQANLTMLDVLFTNQIDHTNSAHWTNAAPSGIDSQWWPVTNQARPYSEEFYIRSSFTSYRLGINTNFTGGVVVMSVSLADSNPSIVYSQNIVGYALFSCLVPCAPEDADGAPTDYTFTLKLVPDIDLQNVIQENGNVYGVEFSWNYASTFLLQGSHDLNNWTNVTYIYTEGSDTTWTTNTPLNSFGNFFRVALVANGHPTNLPPITSALAALPQTRTQRNFTGGPQVTGCKPGANGMVVSVSTAAGQTVDVQAIDSHSTVLQTKRVTAKGKSATAIFDPATLPNPVFFQAVAVQ